MKKLFQTCQNKMGSEYFHEGVTSKSLNTVLRFQCLGKVSFPIQVVLGLGVTDCQSVCQSVCLSGKTQF